MKYLLPLPLFLVLSACLPDQRTAGWEAEEAYVDLLYALHTDHQPSAEEALTQLSEQLGSFRSYWRLPVTIEEEDYLFFRLERAEQAYGDVIEAVNGKDLALAAVHLDRATYEYRAADPVAFHDLYVGNIYDFLITWLEVDYIVGEADLCQLEWPEFTHYSNDAIRQWRRVRNYGPHPIVYPAEKIDPSAFITAREAVDRQMETFSNSLKKGDQCIAQEMSSEVTAAVWELVLLFGSPTLGPDIGTSLPVDLSAAEKPIGFAHKSE